jgi:hypothetical protein
MVSERKGVEGGHSMTEKKRRNKQREQSRE